MTRHPLDLMRSLQKRCCQSRLSIAEELRLLRDPALPAKQLAAAFALGTLISFIPVPVLDSLLVGLVLTRGKQINRAAIFIARLVWNDFLVYPLFGPGYRLGSALVAPLTNGPQPILGGSAVTAALSILAATLILAAAAASAGYLLFLLGLRLYRAISLAPQRAARVAEH